MKVVISTQHIEHFDPEFKIKIEEKTIASINKYFSHAPSAHVNFVKEGKHPKYRYGCTIVVNGGTGRHDIVTGEHFSEDMYDSFHVAMSCVEKQLSKLHSKIKDHHI